MNEDASDRMIDVINDHQVIKYPMEQCLTSKARLHKVRLGEGVIAKTVEFSFQPAPCSAVQTAEERMSFLIEHPAIIPAHLAAAGVFLDEPRVPR